MDEWQLETWESYRDVPRLGRKTRLREKQREQLWEIFKRVRAGLAERGLSTEAQMFSKLKARLFFAGDLGQRIFQQPFSWKALGVNVQGRSSTLKINYRTSHQIRMQADRLLASEVSDVDGNVEERKGTVSVFNGPRRRSRSSIRRRKSNMR